MKKILTVVMGLMCAVGLASCNKESDAERQERDIYYTVAGANMLTGLTGNTVHLTTDAEWDALLDRFCDMAHEGEQVTFCNTHPSTPSAAKASGTETPTHISTTSREELKEWMKAMEKAGKTVNVIYNDTDGTWNGTAYANLMSQDEESEPHNYTGTLVFIDAPVLEETPLEGSVMALLMEDGSTLILTFHGMMFLVENEADVSLLAGLTFSLNGTVSRHTDLEGTVFETLEVVGIDGDVIFIEE